MLTIMYIYLILYPLRQIPGSLTASIALLDCVYLSGENFFIFHDVMLLSLPLYRTVFHKADRFLQSKVLF